jgi:hypothetical protein
MQGIAQNWKDLPILNTIYGIWFGTGIHNIKELMSLKDRGAAEQNLKSPTEVVEVL